MKKNILFSITNLEHGGAERVLVNLVNNLDKSKYNITLKTIFDTGINKRYLSSDVNYDFVFSKTFHGIKFITKFLPANVLHRLFIKNKYDIEIAYLEGPPAKIISGCKNKKTKKLAWIHIELNNKKIFKEGFFSFLDAVKSYKKFDKIVCVSQSVKDIFQNISGNTNTIVKYNTNETEKIRKLSEEKVSDISVSYNYPIICSVAKIEYSKGYDRLIEVHKRLIDEGYKHKIYVVGTGSEEECLKKRISDLGIIDSFVFLGFRENPYKYIKMSDLYICSSRREGFSTAVTESLILGTPVISTDCSGARELLGYNNEYGIVVQNSTEGIYEGIKMLLGNPDLINDYKERVGKRGNMFSINKTIKEIEEMLDVL